MVPLRAHSSSVAAPAEPCSLRGLASATFFGLLLVGLLAGCGSGSGGTSASSPPATVTQTVGSAGGTVSLPAGKVSLTIPPGALSTDTPITVTAVSNAGSAGAVYQFGPSGLIFNQPVTVTLSLDSSLLPPGTNVQDLILSYVDDYLEILTDVQIDSANSTITGKATHFSNIGWGTSTAVKNQLGRVINVSDITTTVTSFRMPIGEDIAGSDLGEDLGLLDASSTWTNFDYPKRSFNMNALSNRWYVVTAFDRDRWLNNGWEEPSLQRDDDKVLACSKDPSLYLHSSRYSCGGSFHPGEDWSLRGGGNLGKPIHAIADGIVLLNQSQNIREIDKNRKWTGAWTDKGTFGNILIIGHKLVGGQVIASVYAHMKDPSIYGVGQPVSKGVEIGRIGGTGGVDPHLHLEIAKPDDRYFKIDADGTIKIPIFLGDRLKGDLTIQGWRWPGPNSQFIKDNYYEPSKFIKNFLPPPSLGIWSVTGSLVPGRLGHSATLLPNGKVLVEGGSNTVGSGLTSTKLYDMALNVGAGDWISTLTGDLTTPRYIHTATLLPNGKVLAVGGGLVNGSFVNSTELYDPAAVGGAGAWSTIRSPQTGRYVHTATLLQNGQVLVVGGGANNGSIAFDSVELYDPALNGGAGDWISTCPLRTGRYLHTATLLPNGKVLVVGGSDAGGNSLASAELYDPAANGCVAAWTPTTRPLTTGRQSHTATLLPNGQVLVVGGRGTGGSSLASAELYDPAANSGAGDWFPAGSLNTGRYLHTATLLPNGQVLAVGGGTNDGSTAIASAELYDPAANGGAGIWTPTFRPLTTGRYLHTATLLPNGQVLVVGGGVVNGPPTGSAELFQ